MTKTVLRKLSPLLLGGAFALGLSLSSNAQAEELRIGFLVPVTGIYAQIGKDMVDGFQLYLDQVKGKFGGADGEVHRRGRTGQAGDGGAQGLEAGRPGQSADAGRRLARLHRLRIGAGKHARESPLYRLDSFRRRSDAAQAR